MTQRRYLKRVYWIILLSGLMVASCDQKDRVINRAHQPWAMRSVLDYKPRMLTLALDSVMYAAYDLENCALYKLWRGGVNWDGIVFTDTKVIQPTTWGTDYTVEPDQVVWEVEVNGKKKPANVRFAGYRFQQDQIVLSYQIIQAQDTVTIEELPEYYSDQTGAPGFERRFTRKGNMQHRIFLNTQNQVIAINQKHVTLSTEYETLPPQRQKPSLVRTDDRGRYWLEKSDCFTCHEWEENTVGPAFETIAAKYENTPEVTDYLIARVKEGGSGVWGSTLMNPHPHLDHQDLKLMIEFILSLDNDKAEVASNTGTPQELPKVIDNPGFGSALSGVHPSYDLETLDSAEQPFAVGGLAFFPDGRLVVTTWTPEGYVYLLDGVTEGDPENIQVTRIAEGLVEPLGVTVVEDQIYVLQKHELTQLIDLDGDQIIDEYRAICNEFDVSTDFHEFAFGLVHRDQHFYANLSIPMRLMAGEMPLPDRGRTVKIGMDGTVEHINYGLRQPNGIGFGVDDEIFVTDHQGQWLPGNKLIHVSKGKFHGMRWVLPDSIKDIPEEPPTVWLPQDEIANSPSEPTTINDGPYKGQMLYGDVSHGGIKRVYLEKVNGAYQGAVFRFTQGLKAGVNRLRWGPDGALYIGGVGMVGGWSWRGQRSGLQKIKYNGAATFEILSVSAQSDGFTIEFTEPLAAGHAESTSDYLVKQWWYLPTAAYGGPKQDETIMDIRKVTVSEDRRSVSLEIPGLKPGHVVYFLLNDQLTSKDNQSLWSGEAWYTLNNKPGTE